MKTQMYYYIPYDLELAEILNRYSHSYNHVTEFVKYGYEPMLQFYVNKEDEVWNEIKDKLPREDVHRLVFTDHELSSAKWLTVRSTNMKIDSEGDNTFSYVCPGEIYPPYLTKYHTTQVGKYEFKPVKWKNNNHFYSTYLMGFETIFCDDFAKNFFEQNGFDEVSFEDVIWYKKGCVLPDAHQIIFGKQLPKEAIVLDDHVREIVCPGCGKIQYFFTNDFRLGIKEEYLDESKDAYTTPAMFGEVTLHSLNIVSGRVYKALKEAKMIRNLRFEPVVLY